MIENGGFNLLLTLLDPDRAAAGDIYLDMSVKLRKYFSRSHSRSQVYDQSSIDELVDESLDRLARSVVKKHRENEVIENIHALLFKIARNVFLEYIKKIKPSSLAEVADPAVFSIGVIDHTNDDDAVYDCLTRCLDKLGLKDRRMVLDYYNTGENEKNKDIRKALAERIGKTAIALKVYMNRKREQLRECVKTCLKDKNRETKEAI